MDYNHFKVFEALVPFIYFFPLKEIQFIALRMEQVQATCIFVEQEVEYELLFIMDVVNQRLNSMKVSQGTPRIELWKTPFYDIKVGSLIVIDFV
jgi:hypothetical protein